VLGKGARPGRSHVPGDHPALGLLGMTSSSGPVVGVEHFLAEDQLRKLPALIRRPEVLSQCAHIVGYVAVL